MENLAGEVHVLREVLDELREQYEWALRNRECPQDFPPFVPLTSLPRDPFAKDFGERINCLKPTDLHQNETPGNSTIPEELF